MLVEQFTHAVAAAQNGPALEYASRQLWGAHGEGRLDDAEAQIVAEAIQAKRALWAARLHTPPAIKLRRPHPRSSDRQASIERRRRQASSGAMPPALAAMFTQGENAALAVIGRECQRAESCSLPIDAIAGLAGICRTLVQRALGEARRLGLIVVKERRQRGDRSLTNIVRVISPEWKAWLRLEGGVGSTKKGATFTNRFSMGKTAVTAHSKGEAKRLQKPYEHPHTPNPVARSENAIEKAETRVFAPINFGNLRRIFR